MARLKSRKYSKWMPPVFIIKTEGQTKRGDCVAINKIRVHKIRGRYGDVNAKIVNWIDKEINRAMVVLRENRDEYIGCIISARAI